MQKISLARAVLKNSQLLIMDEPSNHLDIDGYNWLSEYFSKSKQTILYITHDEAIAKFADKIIEL